MDKSEFLERVIRAYRLEQIEGSVHDKKLPSFTLFRDISGESPLNRCKRLRS